MNELGKLIMEYIIKAKRELDIDTIKLTKEQICAIKESSQFSSIYTYGGADYKTGEVGKYMGVKIILDKGPKLNEAQQILARIRKRILNMGGDF